MENTKEKILSKSVELFFSRGIKETTMDNLASELGMSKKTLYKYFANKDDLVRETVLYLSDRICKKIDELEAQNLNPYEDFFAVRKMINSIVKELTMEPYRQMKKYYPALVKEMEQIKRKRIFDFLENNFNKGIQAGYYKKNLNREFFKRMFFGCKYVLQNEDIFPQDLVQKYIFNSLFIKLYLQSISTKKGKKELKNVLKKYEI